MPVVVERLQVRARSPGTDQGWLPPAGSRRRGGERRPPGQCAGPPHRSRVNSDRPWPSATARRGCRIRTRAPNPGSGAVARCGRCSQGQERRPGGDAEAGHGVETKFECGGQVRALQSGPRGAARPGRRHRTRRRSRVRGVRQARWRRADADATVRRGRCALQVRRGRCGAQGGGRWDGVSFSAPRSELELDTPGANAAGEQAALERPRGTGLGGEEGGGGGVGGQGAGAGAGGGERSEKRAPSPEGPGLGTE